jgi:serine/threonine protein kinase
MIALPWKSPFEKALQFRDCPNNVMSFCLQFIKGVAFFHQHKVAHCDLKPGNVVVDTTLESKTLPRLFIIDFDLAHLSKARKPWQKVGVGCHHGSLPSLDLEMGRPSGTIQSWLIGGLADG